jgi:threonine dehydrogenase-like Zn-dependent dehydrogenase
VIVSTVPTDQHEWCSGFAQAIALAHPAGTVVVATRGIGSGAPGFSPDLVVFKELRVMGALGVDSTAYRAALDLLMPGGYRFESYPATASASNTPRNCWIPLPVNPTVSHHYMECSTP